RSSRKGRRSRGGAPRCRDVRQCTGTGLSCRRPVGFCRRVPPPRHRLARACEGAGVSTLWPYFWPPIGAGIIVGVIAGLVAFRRRPIRNLVFAIGLVLSLGLRALSYR